MTQSRPNKKAQMTHVINLIAIANIDGNITESEKQLIFDIADHLGLTDDEFDVCVKTCIDSPDKVFFEVPDTDEEKTYYLKNLTTMMMIDGQIDDNEKAYIKIVAEKFGYDGEKALEILMDSVYGDFAKEMGTIHVGSDTHVPEQDGKESTMSEDEFTAETRRLTALGKEALVNHEFSQAFDYLLMPAHVDGEALQFFLMIINTFTRLYLLTEKQVAQLKTFAEKGYAVSQYAYGRYLYIVRPDNDSIKMADQYFKQAEKAGMGDAIQAQSTIMLDGHYGQVNIEEAYEMTEKAIQKNSELAARAYLRRIVFGTDFMEPDPQRAIDIIKQMLPNESDDIFEVNPIYYEILGDAYEKLDDKEKAKDYYMKAIEMGYIEAYGSYCILHNNTDGNDLLNEMYEAMLDIGCAEGDPTCYVYRAAFHMDNYDDCAENEKAGMTKAIKEDLETAAKLGNQIAPYFLGDAYYKGLYGFEEDNIEAWNWFIEGSKRDEGNAYKMLAIMISNEENPYEVKEGLMEYCAIMSVRGGCDDLLEVVVKSYRNGELTDYAAEIEKYYIPKYDAQPHDTDDEEEDDDDEETGGDDGYKLIAIVKTDGTADIIEYDVEEGWDEMPEFVGAKRLDSIRTQPLYDLSERFGVDGHIAAWVDNMGLMKELPMNPIGCKLYPGPIAGDMILTVEDQRYNPKSFGSLDQLKKIVAALGAKLDNVVLDEGPDDDGRYDAWS